MALYVKKQKRILKKILVGTCIFMLGAVIFFLLSGFWSSQPLLLVFVMTLISILAYKPLDAVFSKLFNQYLFKKKSYGQMVLMNLADELSLILDLQELANLIVNTFGEVLHLQTVALMLPSKKREDFEIISAYGWNVSDSKRVRLGKDSPLICLIHDSGPHILVRDLTVRSLAWQEANRLSHDFDSLRASWVIPLFVKDQFMGLMAFAGSRPEEVFDESDFHFFREFASSVTKSIRNARVVFELKIANEELQDVQSQLLQATKLAAIEQLATGIAHEIHNPLTIISGKAQVLLLQRDRNQIDERVEEVLKTIVKQTKRAADITRKLLMFSQNSGAPKEQLHLEQVLDDTMALVSYQTSLEGIRISKSVANSLPPFFANVHELREVFLSLILNAVQSIGSQGEIRCELNYRAGDQVLEIRISDNGRGIPEENIGKLFNPFFTTRPDAVGLGLFVTKQIVNRYGGSIRVDSRIGEGSLFIVQLPATPQLSGGMEKTVSLPVAPVH